MKRIEVLKTFSSAGQRYFAEEIRFVSAEDCRHFCSCGWARDLGGEAHTGEPDLTPKTLKIEKLSSRTELRHGEIRK